MGIFDSKLSDPWKICVSTDSRLLLLSDLKTQIQIFASTRLIKTIPIGQVNDINWSEDGNILLSLHQGVEVLSSDGQFIKRVKLRNTDKALAYVGKLCLDSLGNIITTDILKRYVLKFDPLGNRIKEFQVDCCGKYHTRIGIDVDEADNVFIVCYYGAEILILNREGKTIDRISLGHFGIFVDCSTIFIRRNKIILVESHSWKIYIFSF